jgi:hypothetical protein
MLHPHAEGLGQAQSRFPLAGYKLAAERRGGKQNPLDFFLAQDHQQSLGPVRPDDAVELF